eukprot:TRINITY_DN15887_c0_g1_i1.p1 TRINITY_DN15887_c0_g1~~TRINITY_DN15887_c0_g1_i1.p1  ORF type:complete len:120 (-),score=15.19 TRINITY_DN15887_c0_g1_i1:505-864(-)
MSSPQQAHSISLLTDAIGLSPVKATILEDVVQVMSTLISQMTVMGFVQSYNFHHAFLFTAISIAAYQKAQRLQIGVRNANIKLIMETNTYVARTAQIHISLTRMQNWVTVRLVRSWPCS